MKKIIASMLGIFIAVPLLLAVWGFALPAQYSGTFLGENCPPSAPCWQPRAISPV